MNRNISQMKRHRTEGTRRMAAHPTLPLCKYEVSVLEAAPSTSPSRRSWTSWFFPPRLLPPIVPMLSFRCFRITRWICNLVGMEPSSGYLYTKIKWNLWKSDPLRVQSTWKQVRRLRRWWEPQSLASCRFFHWIQTVLCECQLEEN